MFIIAYPSKRFRKAWLGIAVHSVQTVAFTAVGRGVELNTIAAQVDTASPLRRTFVPGA